MALSIGGRSVCGLTATTILFKTIGCHEQRAADAKVCVVHNYEAGGLISESSPRIVSVGTVLKPVSSPASRTTPTTLFRFHHLWSVELRRLWATVPNLSDTKVSNRNYEALDILGALSVFVRVAETRNITRAGTKAPRERRLYRPILILNIPL